MGVGRGVRMLVRETSWQRPAFLALGDPCPVAAVPASFPEVPVYQKQVFGDVPILPFTKSPPPPPRAFIKLS